jgi:hypothetical protein
MREHNYKLLQLAENMQVARKEAGLFQLIAVSRNDITNMPTETLAVNLRTVMRVGEWLQQITHFNIFKKVIMSPQQVCN